MQGDIATRPVGRPRDRTVDERILAAAERILVEDGVEALTMTAVVARSGVARATVYRRWTDRRELLAAVVRRAMGRAPFEPPHDLLAALYLGATFARDVIASPEFWPLIGVTLASLLSPPDDPAHLTVSQLFPGRDRVALAYGRHAGEIGLRDDVSGELVTDVILGTLFWRAAVRTRPPTTEEARAVVDLLLDGLRRPAAETV
jgi:AcrR family transcriptional regulator